MFASFISNNCSTKQAYVVITGINRLSCALFEYNQETLSENNSSDVFLATSQLYQLHTLNWHIQVRYDNSGMCLMLSISLTVTNHAPNKFSVLKKLYCFNNPFLCIYPHIFDIHCISK